MFDDTVEQKAHAISDGIVLPAINTIPNSYGVMFLSEIVQFSKRFRTLTALLRRRRLIILIRRARVASGAPAAMLRWLPSISLALSYASDVFHSSASAGSLQNTLQRN